MSFANCWGCYGCDQCDPLPKNYKINQLKNKVEKLKKQINSSENNEKEYIYPKFNRIDIDEYGRKYKY